MAGEVDTVHLVSNFYGRSLSCMRIYSVLEGMF